MSNAIHRHERSVLFQEIDAAGIVFYARIFDWFHDAYASCLAAKGIDLPALLRAETWAAPLVHAEADYQRPFRFGDQIAIEVVKVELGEKSMTVHYRIAEQSDPATTRATGRTVHAYIDRKSGRSRTIPDEVSAAFGRT